MNTIMWYVYCIGIIISYPLIWIYETRPRYWVPDGFLSVVFNPWLWPITIPYTLYEKRQKDQSYDKELVKSVMTE